MFDFEDFLDSGEFNHGREMCLDRLRCDQRSTSYTSSPSDAEAECLWLVRNECVVFAGEAICLLFDM